MVTDKKDAARRAALFVCDELSAVRVHAFLLCCPRRVLPQNSRQSSTKTAVFLSTQPCWQRGNRCQSPIISASTKDDLPAFLLCCPRRVLPQNSRQSSTKTTVFLSTQTLLAAGQPLPITNPWAWRQQAGCPLFCCAVHGECCRKTAASFQPRQPFFFLSRKKEKVGGKKKESFAYGKNRNAVPSLRYGKAAFHFAYHVRSVHPALPLCGIAQWITLSRTERCGSRRCSLLCHAFSQCLGAVWYKSVILGSCLSFRAFNIY